MGEETHTLYPAGINKRKLPTEVEALKKQKQELPVDLSAPSERAEDGGDPNGNVNFIDHAVAEDRQEEEGGVPNGSADGKGKGVAIATSPVQDKGKAVVLDKGKSVMLGEDDDEDGSDDDSDDSDDSDEGGAIGLEGGEDSSDFDDDPLAELDLDNVLPSRTRKKQPPPPGSYLVNDLDEEEEDDDDDGFD